jgi:hypothetical protein
MPQRRGLMLKAGTVVDATHHVDRSAERDQEHDC